MAVAVAVAQAAFFTMEQKPQKRPTARRNS
jgi:hypothetical protein